MLVRSNFFSQFVEKIEKFILSLSKLHNKVLKIRSEMLKARKKQNYQARESFPVISRIPGIPKIFGIPGIPALFSQFSRKILENFPFSDKLKIREKGKP